MVKRRSMIEGSLAAAALMGTVGAGAARAQSQSGHLLAIDGLSSAFSLTPGNQVEKETLAAIKASGLAAINMTTPRPGGDFRSAVSMISRLLARIDAHSSDLRLVRGTADIHKARERGQLGIIIGFQSTEMFDESLDGIELFHGLGARIMQMSYNGPGLFGHGCLSESAAGVTESGRGAIERMNHWGVLIDASHSNKQTTADTISLSTKPITISHTGCNSVYVHPRNNDDVELRAMAERGGVAGIYLMPFLDGGSGELTTQMLMLHIARALDVCGEDHVGIGSDQGVRPVNDGPEYRRRLREEVARRKAAGISAPGESADRPPFIPALNYADRLHRLAGIMSSAGYPERIVEKVIGGNFLRVMNEAWGHESS